MFCVAVCVGTKASLVLKLGPKYDMGALCPKAEEGWEKAAKGKNWCVWTKPVSGGSSSQ